MARHPLLRLAAAFDAADLAVALPPVTIAHAVGHALGRYDAAAAPTLEERDAAFVDAFLDGFAWLGRTFFDLRIAGVENVPASGPGLLVGNHSGGLVTLDAVFTLAAVRDAYGLDRAVYGLGHDFVYRDPAIGKYTRRLGVLKAGHDGANTAFRAGHLALVYPGSDYDSFRPFAERNRIVLAHRTGFVKLALRAGVPVLPVVTIGGQEQFLLFSRGETLARLLRLPKLLRSNVFPWAVSIPWGVAPAFLPYLPLPARIRQEFLPPIAWPHLPPEAADDPATVDACYREVETAMQAALDRMAKGRRLWFG
jgi:1-acyl-sn-glycerol-3-phosphate acyltransferase